MKRNQLVLFLFLLPGVVVAQEEWHRPPRRSTPVTEADMHINKRIGSDDFDYGYQPASAPGWTIKNGDTLQLGKGTMPDRSFAFIYQETGGGYLSNLYTGTHLVVKELNTIGRKKVGYATIAIVRARVRYYIQLEDAIQTGELIPPAPYMKPKSPGNQTAPSVADELLKFKTLLDSGAITQEEYDTQKKKLLAQ